MKVSVKSKDIALWLKQKTGKDTILTGVCSVNNIKPNSLMFTSSTKPINLSDDEKELIKTCLVIVKDKNILSENTSYIESDNPRLCFAKTVRRFFASSRPKGIHNTAIIESKAGLSNNVAVGAYSIIEDNVVIGDNVIIGENVVIRSGTVIGSHSHIRSGSVIGDEGFGFDFDEYNLPVRIPHTGGVKIGNYVEIGTNCVVSRGTIEDTIVSDHVKINDLVHIAHNVFIGTNTIIAGGKLSGSVKVGRDCWLAPGVVVQNKVYIGDNSFIGTGAVVVNNIPSNVVAYGNPAKEVRKR